MGLSPRYCRDGTILLTRLDLGLASNVLRAIRIKIADIRSYLDNDSAAKAVRIFSSRLDEHYEAGGRIYGQSVSMGLELIETRFRGRFGVSGKTFGCFRKLER